jgi:hypothetical protein
MKFNWGYKILMVYGLFVVGMLFLVFKSTQQKYDLVQKDYYADELKYQQVINASAKAKALGGELKTERRGGHLIIALPAAFHQATVKGKAHLYYAADDKRDISKEFVTVNGEFDMELLTIMSGSYTLKLELEMEGVAYYYEQKLFF